VLTDCDRLPGDGSPFLIMPLETEHGALDLGISLRRAVNAVQRREDAA